MTKAEREKERNQLVVKSNDLIQFGRHDLTVMEQKVLVYLISKIQPNDTEFKMYEFSIAEFCECCGLTTGGKIGGKEYQRIKSIVQSLRDKSWWSVLDGDDVLLSWVSKARIARNDGIIKIQLDSDLKPYLLQLRSNFTQYEMINCLGFKSKYSFSIYEWCCSKHFRDLEAYTWCFNSLDDFRRQFGIDKYPVWQDLKRRVLDVAVSEINRYSNKNISYTVIKRGKSVVGLKLTVSSKAGMDMIDAHVAVNAMLDEGMQNE